MIAVRGLRVVYEVRSAGRRRRITAVDGIDFDIARGTTLGLVGESGCGKSTTGRAVLMLRRPTSGSVQIDGVELTTLDADALRRTRRRAQLVFQDSYSSLDPRARVGRLIGEPLRVHRLVARDMVASRVEQLLHKVGLDPSFARRFPHELSGGQRQRIGIARALASEPSFVVCDEPVSALDVSIQAQILALLTDLQAEFGLTYLFISHDLGVIRQVADEVAVMYLGRIVERGPADEVLSRPLHPYTMALVSAAPRRHPDGRERIRLTGELPSVFAPPSGCRFHSRCPAATPRCALEDPAPELTPDGRTVACLRWRDLAGP